MMHRLTFRAMGSRMLGIVDTEEVPTILNALPARFEEWEQALSRFRNDSELCMLNRRASEPVEVSQVLWDVFQASLDANARTLGLVNPLITEALIHAGYDRSFEQMEGTLGYSNLDLARDAVPTFSDVIVDSEARSIELPAGAALDFGGVAKGWAAQQSMLILGRCGPALFSAGGDIAISGPLESGEPWDITVDDPFHPGEHIETLFVERGGVATSGRDYRQWRIAGSLHHHIIDPRTALPADTDIVAATVIAPDAMLAEAYAKAILISGSEAGLAWLNRGKSLAGLLVLENGERLYSRNMGDYL